MRDMHNADLCGTIGNLVHRVTSLCGKYCGGVVPDVPPPSILPVTDIDAVIQSYKRKMNGYELQGGANIAIQGFRDVNGYLQESAPWHIVNDTEAQQIIVRAALEAVYVLTHLLLPFLPEGCVKIFAKLGTEPVSLSDLRHDCRNLAVGTCITVGDILYEPSQSDHEANAETAAVTKKESHAEAQQRKKEAKAKQIAASKAKQAASATGDDELDSQPDFTKMDIRVGKIVKVWLHEAADKLFCEQIDVGDEDGPREIASGLRQYYTIDEMQDRLVLVVCNLKAAKIVGFTSNGMVLAAKSTDGTKVELIDAPSDSVVGERVYVDGLVGEALTSTQVKKKKVWETVAMKLTTGESGVAMWDGRAIHTSTGICKAATLVDAPIS
jgi:methionine--tRNA ligase beta chain